MHVRCTTFLFFSLAITLGAAGCGGGGDVEGPKTVPVPTIVGVAPAEAWRADSVTISITGIDTAWSPTSPPIVDAGPDITIDAVTVDGPQALSVAARIAYDAAPGLRTILVKTGSAILTTPDFRVKAPISASWFSQPFVRSSVLVGVIAVNRPGDTLDGPVVAVASTGSLLPLFLDDPRGFIVTLPEDAPLGPFDIFVHRTGTDGASTFRLPGGLIQLRTNVFESFPMAVSLPTVDGTALHRYTTSTACYLEFPMTSADPTLPIHFLYAHASPFAPPIIGRAPILYGSGTLGPRAVALPGETFDVVVFSGHTAYTIAAVESTTTPVAEIEPNSTSVTAQPISLPALVAPATMNAATGDDWFSFIAAPGDVGKRVRVVTSPGPALTVLVVRADGASILSGASASGAGAAIDLHSNPIPAAETLYVRVSSGATLTSPDVTPSYRLFVRLENP